MSDRDDPGDCDGWRPADSPNLATLWGRSLVDELARHDVPVVYAPGSRSTPLVAAACRHPGVETFRHLDERSAAFFAVGWGRRTGRPAAVVTTSGTATANLHPGVMEADQGRVPLVAVTADRPADLRDSGANQTADQAKLYGDAVRWYREVPEPGPRERALRRLRTDAARAIAVAAGAADAPGPVHLNVPFRKPLDPLPPADSPECGDADRVPDDLAERAGNLVGGEVPGSDDEAGDDPYVRWWGGREEPHDAAVAAVAEAVNGTERGLIVAGPGDHSDGALVALSATTGYPLLADPLSGLRYGPAVERAPVCGGYDTYVDPRVTGDWPAPEVVIGVGASPTSKPLRKYLARVETRRVLVDPAGGWRDATFTTTDQVVADPDALATAVLERLELPGSEAGDPVDADEARTAWTDRWLDAETAHRETLSAARDGEISVEVRDGDDTERVTPAGPEVEGVALAAAVEAAPADTTVFASNSTPVRDLDRFVPPETRPLTTLGNRGVSGIDGITSTAAGATVAGEEPGLLLAGDLAWLHDSNGHLALREFDVDLTAVVLNNDGGGIFHALPIEDVDPPFTEAFRTPHGLTFEGTAETFGVEYRRVAPADLPAACERHVGDGGPTVLETSFDAAVSHRVREAVVEQVVAALE